MNKLDRPFLFRFLEGFSWAMGVLVALVLVSTVLRLTEGLWK